jgi:enterochelin esterase family protein
MDGYVSGSKWRWCRRIGMAVVSLLALLPAGALAQQAPAPAAPPDISKMTPAQIGALMARMNPCGDYVSVEQLADGKVTFRICAPDAKIVAVTSSDTPAIPMFADLPMTRNEKGLWTATTAIAVPADTYRYAFKVDGVRANDPKATTFSFERTGTYNTFETKGPDGTFQTYDPAVPHGTVATIEYWSKSLNAKRRAHIYLPPGYMNDGKAYPVFYLVHGAGDSDDSWTSVGHANYIIDNLLAAGQASPMIVVMPFGHTPDKPGANMLANTDFSDDFLKDLIPYIEANYRTINDPAHRAMAGLSMGGAHTIQNGLPHSDLFSYIGIFSIGLMGDEQIGAYEAKNGAALDASGKTMKVVRYYCGTEDFLYKTVAPTAALMKKHGIKVEVIESGGGHTWINWRRYLKDFVPYLFK